MNTAGLLSFDIYNNEGKNELFIASGEDFTQSLKIRIGNKKPGHLIKINKTSNYHFSLSFKKGLLPNDFDVSKIKVTKWRQVNGADVLNKTKIKELNAFNVSDIKSKLNLDLNPILAKLEALKTVENQKQNGAPPTKPTETKPATSAASKTKTKAQKTEKNVAVSTDSAKEPAVTKEPVLLEKIAASLNQAGSDVKSGFDSILELLKIVKDKDFQEKHKWVLELEGVRDMYVKSLLDLKNITQEGGILSQNALMAEGFEKMTAVFQSLANLHQRTLRILAELEVMDLNIQKKKATITTNAYETLKNQLVTDFKPFVEDFFRVDTLLSQLKNIKLSDFFNLDQVSLNEDIVRQMERKLVVEETEAKGQWSIKKVASKGNEEEEELQFLCTSPKHSTLTIGANGYILIDITLNGSLKGKAESTNVELNYPSAEFYKDGTLVKPTTDKAKKENKISQVVLNLLNYGDLGLFVPLTMNIVQGKDLLNNGEYANKVTIQLTNNGREAILFNEDARLELNFDVQNEMELKSSALMEKDNVKALKAALIPLDALEIDATQTKQHKVAKGTLDKDIMIKHILSDKVDKNEVPLFPGYSFTFFKKRIEKFQSEYYPQLIIFKKSAPTSKVWEIYSVEDAISDKNKIDIIQEAKLFAKATIKTVAKEKTKEIEIIYDENNKKYRKGNKIKQGEKSIETFTKPESTVDFEILKDKFCPGYMESDSLVVSIKEEKSKSSKESKLLYVYYNEQKTNTLYEYTDGFLLKTVKGLENCYVVSTIKSVETGKVPDGTAEKSKYVVTKYDKPKRSKVVRINRQNDPGGSEELVTVETFKKLKINEGLKKTEQTINANYFYQFEANFSLPPKKSLVVKLKDLKTKLPIGSTNIEIALLNVPKYRNSRFIASFNRVSYLTTAENGIFNRGTTNDELLISSKLLKIRSGPYALQIHPQQGLKIMKDDNPFLEFADATSLYRQILPDVTSLYRQLLPVGSIIMWHGEKDKIPKGWAICDGNNGTPDLVDRFIVGAGDDKNWKKSGGANEVTLTIGQMPKHSHTINKNDFYLHSRSFKGSDGNDIPYKTNGEEKYRLNGTDEAGGGQAHENLPPFYALYYIMRI